MSLTNMLRLKTLAKVVTKNQNGLASVMGHEIAHALLAHSAEKISRGLALQAGLTAFAYSQSDKKYSKYTVQGAALAAIIALELPNSRNAESEADRIGIEIAANLPGC